MSRGLWGEQLERTPSLEKASLPGSGYLFIGALAILMVWLLGLIWSLELEQVIQRFTHDDTFYYLETARRFAASEGFTFDGRNPTNGFHPLWMFLLVPLFWISNSDPGSSLRLALSFQTVFLLAPSLALLFFATRKRFGDWAAMAGLISGIWLFPARQVNGMESGVLILTFSALIFWVLREAGRSKEPRFQFIAGVILGFAFLARTDSIFLIAGWGFAILIFETIDEGPAVIRGFSRRILPAAIGVVLVSGPYLLFNQLTEGTLLPISGALKSSLPHLTFSPGFMQGTIGFTIAGVLSLLGGLLPPLESGESSTGRPFRTIMIMTGLYVLFHALFTLFAMEWAVLVWHFSGYAMAVVVLSVFIAVLLRRHSENGGLRLSGVVQTMLVCFLCLSLARAFWGFRHQPALAFYVHSYRASLWANANLPRDARIGMKDAGAFGYFTEASVTNLDGVINNFSYQDYLRKGNLAEYLRDQGITHVAQHALWQYPEVETGNYQVFEYTIVSHLYDVPGGSVKLRRENEVYRVPVFDSGRETSFVIWQIDSPRGSGSPSSFLR